MIEKRKKVLLAIVLSLAFVKNQCEMIGMMLLQS